MSNKFCPNCNQTLSFDDNRKATCACGWAGHPKDSLLSRRILSPTPVMPYVSIDIETTGLNPDTCQILEFGAVLEDWQTPIHDLPKFHRYIVHDTIIGEPFALQMNAAILKKIATHQPGDPDYCTIDQLAGQFKDWLLGFHDTRQRITPAGKNFAGFDRQFLKPYGFDKFFHHRTLDPAPLFWHPAVDDKLPDLKTCLQRAGLDGLVSHTAIDDACAVVHVVRYAIGKMPL